MPIQAPDIVGSFIAGRQARQQEDYGNTRNALARMEAEQLPTEYANRNALAARQQQQFTQEQAMQALTQGKAAAEHIAQHPQAKQFAQSQFPEFVKMAEAQSGKPWQALSDQEVKQFAGGVAQQAAAKLGMGPAPQPVQYESVEGPGGSLLQRNPQTGEMKQVVGREQVIRPEKTAPQYQAMTSEEIAAAGLPAGSSAQRETGSGKIDVLSKRDQTATLSQKDATTAKMKLNTVKLARQQLNNIKQKFAGIKGTLSAGAFGQGKVPTEGGRLFDSAVNQMRSTLTALTRVPGVGAMSDYETKLDQSKFPTRNDYENVIEDQIAQLDNMLNAIESGYTDLLGGAAAQPEQGSAPQAAIDYLKANPQFKGAFKQKYGYLPSDGQ